MAFCKLIVSSALMACCIFSQEAAARDRVAEIPQNFLGRWVAEDLSADGKYQADLLHCENSSWASADIVITSHAILSDSNLHIVVGVFVEDNPNEIRVDLADNAGGKVAVGTELFVLSSDRKFLTIANQPQLGWEEARYERCPAPPIDGSLSLVP